MVDSVGSIGRNSSTLRTTTADPLLMQRLRQSRNSGDLSANEFVKGSMYASYYVGSEQEKLERAERVRRSVEKGLHKDNINYDEYKNLGTYLRSLDRRLSIPKHQRRSSAASQEESVSHSRNYNNHMGNHPFQETSNTQQTLESPRQPHETKLYAIRLGQDVLNPEF